MDDTLQLQENIEYIFDYQTKLSHDLPLNKVQLFEIDLTNSILNNDSSIQAINNVQEVLTKGFRKLFVNITWDHQENNWKLCNSITNINRNNQYKKNQNDNRNVSSMNHSNCTTTNLIKSIRKWMDNSSECNVIILIFNINAYENIDREKTISCMNGYVEKLEILKRDIMSEISDILYTADMMKDSIYQEKKYQERLYNNISYTNGNWTSIKKLCYMNKKILIGIEPNGLLCKSYKDNILFTDSGLIKKLIQYQDLKKYTLYLRGSNLSKTNKIDKIIKLIDRRTINENFINNGEINNNELSVVFTPDDIANIKKEIIELINNNNMSIHMKYYDINSIQTLKNALLWSWDTSTNFIEDSSNSCIIISRVTGRWNYHSCNDNFPIACKNRNNPLIWIIKTEGDKCDKGYMLSLPYSSEENHMLWQTLQNRTLSSYDNFYLTKIPMEITENLKSDKRDNINFNTKTNEKYLIIPSDLNYTQLIEEIIKTSLSPALMVLIIIVFIITRAIRKQYVIFKKRRRRMDAKKRLKVIETQTVPI